MSSAVPSNVRVEVIVLDGNTRRPLLANGVNKSKLMHFSDLAKGQLKPDAIRGRGWPSHGFILVKDQRLGDGHFDEDAARVLLKWIDGNDIEKPKQLTRGVLEPDMPGTDKGATFKNGVNLYATAHALRIPRQLRGDNVHDSIYLYIKDAPLRFDEFAQVIEMLAFDEGMVKTAKHNVMFKHVKGGAQETPDFKRIQDYCVNVGIWDQMLAIESEIRGRMMVQKQADLKQKAEERAKQTAEERAKQKAEDERKARERAEKPGAMDGGAFPALGRK